MNPKDVLRWGEVIDMPFVELVPTLCILEALVRGCSYSRWPWQYVLNLHTLVGENSGESKESGECWEAPMPLKEVSSSSGGG
jgi:hypothetical protein